MKQDPRYRNDIFDRSSIGAFLSGYVDQLRSVLTAIDHVQLEKARGLIERSAREGRRIFAIGNGGSAAIADHLCCDWTKGTHTHGVPAIDTMSMSSNVALYSAIANDFGFEHVFSTQISMIGKPGDVLLAISSSGNSGNIIAAVEAARAIGMTSIGMSGFNGGKLKNVADVSIHISANNYGIVEDAHQTIVHVLAQFIAAARHEQSSAELVAEL